MSKDTRRTAALLGWERRRYRAEGRRLEAANQAEFDAVKPMSIVALEFITAGVPREQGSARERMWRREMVGLPFDIERCDDATVGAYQLERAASGLPCITHEDCRSDPRIGAACSKALLDE